MYDFIGFSGVVSIMLVHSHWWVFRELQESKDETWDCDITTSSSMFFQVALTNWRESHQFVDVVVFLEDWWMAIFFVSSQRTVDVHLL